MALRFTVLDRPAIRRLTIGQKLTEHGITAERLPTGDVRYAVNIMVDGARIHRVIGKESEGVTRTQCEEFIEKARTDARAGRLSLPKGRKLGLTFSAAADDYVTRLEESGGKNLDRKRHHLNAYLKPFFGTLRIEDISSFTIERYKKRRLDAEAARGTINRELATLSHLFRRAVDWKWIDRVPAQPAKLEESAGRIIALTDPQSDELLRAAVGSADPHCWLFVAFGLNTAMRHGEILRSRFDQLDLGTLRLFIPDAKAGEREQPITLELAEILLKEREARQDRNGWIFPAGRRDARDGHRRRMRGSFRDAVKRAGLDPALVTPHVMRHTAITKLVQAGVDLPTIQRISGHKTLAMVLRYTHVHGRHIDQAIRTIGRTIPEPAANKTADATTPKLHTAAREAMRPASRRGKKSP